VILANTGVVGAVNRLGPLNRNDRNALLPDDFGSPWAFDNAYVQNTPARGAASEKDGNKQVAHTHRLVQPDGLYKCL
jgi:hypothetical protein